MYFEQDSVLNYFLNLSLQSALVCYICIIYSVVGSFIVSASRFYGALCESWESNFGDVMDLQAATATETRIKLKIVDSIEYHLDILE